MDDPSVGQIGWIDITVENAEQLRDFYGAVVGWRPSPVDMGGYEDFTMLAPAGDQPAAGVCHARGVNADLPPQWLIYITVENLDASLTQCADRGGEVVLGPKNMGGVGRYAVIRDPAGAAAALFEPAR